jgi:hypothetical protein
VSEEQERGEYTQSVCQRSSGFVCVCVCLSLHPKASHPPLPSCAVIELEKLTENNYSPN